MSTQLLTMEQVAQRLGFSVGHIYRLVERGDLERVKIGAAVRVSEAALEDFIAERTQSARRTRRAVA
jgi:excisionase family DNA binding protein